LNSFWWGQLRPAQVGSVKKSPEGADNPAHAVNKGLVQAFMRRNIALLKQKPPASTKFYFFRQMVFNLLHKIPTKLNYKTKTISYELKIT